MRYDKKNIEEIDIYEILLEEKNMKLKGGLYHFCQIKMSYNSNKIEGSKLSEDETKYIYETKMIDTKQNGGAYVDDIIETVNHFACFDYLLDTAEKPLSEEIIKEYHKVLKSSTEDSRKPWFKVGDYKTERNVVGLTVTTRPENVEREMRGLLQRYNKRKKNDLEDLIDFHYKFEKIHPFQDGNGRVGRLILFKECLRNKIMPFIIENKEKNKYLFGINEYNANPSHLIDVCLQSQEKFKKVIQYFANIPDQVKK